jgi:hypothetical protein
LREQNVSLTAQNILETLEETRNIGLWVWKQRAARMAVFFFFQGV